MKSVNYDKDIKELFVILICLIFILGYFTFIKFTYKVEEDSKTGNDVVESVNSFNESFVRNVNSVAGNNNYLVSPYSVELALSMLATGASGSSLDEINNVVGNRNITSFNIQNRIGVANALFIKDLYKNYVIKDFASNLSNNYNTEILYDKFETPDVINKWCKEKTWDMIDSVVDRLDPNFVLGIANAVAVDVEWDSEFDCNSTTSQEFVKDDNSTLNVEMMHKTYNSNASYFSNDFSSGVIIPYKKYDNSGNVADTGNNLEFVGILPSNSISEFINSINEDGLKNFASNATLVGSENKLEVALPRFKYDYDVSDLKTVLQSMGINSIFNETNADFSNIISKTDMSSLGINNLYVDTAIHKTHIDLNEKGTKAAAVTSFGLNTNAAEQTETIKIEFNKPFIYMIRDSASKEILFFGTVYNPNEWKGSTCSND